MTLPNRNEAEGDSVASVSKNALSPNSYLGNQKGMLMEYAIENGQITRKEAEELLEVGATKAFRLLKELCEEGRLQVQGSGRQSKYVPL